MSTRSTHSVLVVDDHAPSRYATARALRAAGFNVVEAAGGAQALELARYVSAVVLDVHLPDLHGFEVCRLLRERPETARLPVVHVSGVYVQDVDIADGRLSGGDDYFVNPVDYGVLAARLDELLASGTP